MAAHLSHWSRFSLRSLFVIITLVGIGVGYVGHQWRIVKVRREVLLELSPPLSPWFDRYIHDGDKIIAHRPVSLGRMRTLLGDKEQSGGYLLPQDPEMQARVLSAFPEAEVRTWNAQMRRFVPVDERGN